MGRLTAISRAMLVANSIVNKLIRGVDLLSLVLV